MQKDIRKIEAVNEYLLNAKIYDQFEEVIKKYNLQNERLEEFLDLTDAVIKNQIKVNEMLPMVTTAFGLGQETSKALTADLIGYRLLPLVNYIPGVVEELKKMGGDEKKYPALRISASETKAKTSMELLAKKIGLNLPDHLMNRLAFLAKGYLSKERARDATIELMKRRMNIGGLELTEEQAINVLAWLDNERDNFDYEGEIDEKVEKEILEQQKNKKINKEVVNIEPTFHEAEREHKIANSVTKEEILADIKRFDKDHPEFNQQKKIKSKEIKKERIRADVVQDNVKSNNNLRDAYHAKKDEVDELLFPVLHAFENKYIPRRAYNVSVLAYLRGEEDKTQLLDTFYEYEFSEREIELMLRVINEVKDFLLGRIEKTSLKFKDIPELEVLPSKTPSHDLVKEVPVINGDVINKQQKKSERKINKNVLKKDTLLIKSVTHALTKEVPIISGESVLSIDEVKELQKHRKVAGNLKKEISVTDNKKKIDEVLRSVKEILERNKVLEDKFRSLIEKYIRGIRTITQMQGILRDRYSFDSQDVEKIISALEKARRVNNGENKKKNKVKEKKSIESVKGLENDVMDKRRMVITNKPISENIDNIYNSARVSASRTKKEELELQEKNIDQERLAKIEKNSLPRPAKAKLSKKSIPPSSKIVTDIKFTRKLAGPVDELGMMNVISFRRLSSDPNEAVRKIEDKLDLLESDSFAERIAGIKAWRNSVINKLYSQMLFESLKNNVSISEISAQRRNAGEESLSPAEISAIVSLNNKIKF